MAGGTSRKDHSEVGSSYIHFNYTPDGNKSTASLFGDVARGVMLNQPPIFLGGQGGIIGPVRLGYGNVVAAGSILRKNVIEDNKLIIADTHKGAIRNFIPNSYKNILRLIENNIIYLSNLSALEDWYLHIRRLFFIKQELGSLIYEGAMEKLKIAKNERINRLKIMIEKVPKTNDRNIILKENIDKVCELFMKGLANEKMNTLREKFITVFCEFKKNNETDYLNTIRSLPLAISQQGVEWLQIIINEFCGKSAEILELFNTAAVECE